MLALTQTSTPVDVAHLEFDADTGVRTRPADRPLAFRFLYHGFAFAAELGVDRESPLILTADLGPVPYSAETPLGRRIARAVLAKAHLERGALRQDLRGHLHLVLHEVPTHPRTPVSVVATAVALLMDAKPYLELLDLAQRRPKR